VAIFRKNITQAVHGALFAETPNRQREFQLPIAL